MAALRVQEVDRAQKKQAVLYPDNSLGVVENFLSDDLGLSAEPYRSDRGRSCSPCDLLFTLVTPTHYAELLTATVGWVARPQPTCSPPSPAGIHALSGPLHGGRRRMFIEMLRASGRGRGRQRVRAEVTSSRTA